MSSSTQASPQVSNSSADQPPTVSVIVPNYRHATFLPERLDSILNQTFQDFELILLDDASPDNSRDVLDAYAARDPKRIRTAYNEDNSGSAFKQWNKGIGLSRGKYCWIAESDDVAEPEFLETLVELLENHPHVGLAFCDSVTIDIEGNESLHSREFVLQELQLLEEARFSEVYAQGEGARVFEPGSLLRLGLCAVNLMPNASAALFSREAAESIGKADESFTLCADWLFWGRLATKYAVANSPRPLNRYRKHEHTARAGTKAVRELIERHRVARELTKLGGLDKSDRRAVARVLIKRTFFRLRSGSIDRLGYVRALLPVAGISFPHVIRSLRLLAKHRETSSG